MSDEYKTLRDRLEIDSTNLIEEFRQTPRLFHRVLYLTARARAELNEAEREKSRAFHRLCVKYRTSAKESGGATTKDAIESAARGSREYEDPCNEVIACQEALGTWEALAEAWRARAYMLRDLVKLDLAERERTYIAETSPRRPLDQQTQEPRKRERVL